MSLAPGQTARAGDVLSAIAQGHELGNSGQFYADAGAVVVRYGDRLFAGAAADNPGFTNRNQAPTDWLSAMMGATSIGAYAVWGATTASLSRYGTMGVLGGSRTSDAQSSKTLLGYTPSSIGVGSWAIDDDKSSPRTTNAYAFYGEVWRMTSVGYQPSFAMELECVNFGGNLAGESTPYHVNCGGGSYAIQLGAGGGQTSGTYPAEAGLTFVNNPSTFNAGIVFGSTALSGTDGTSGYGSALQLAAFQALEWRTPETVGGVQGSQGAGYVRSVVTTSAQAPRIELQNGSVFIGNAAGQTVLTISAPASATNTLNIQPGAGQQAAGLYAQQGSGGSANLGLFPASGGELQITSPATSGNAIPAQALLYLHINVNGTDYRVPLLTPTQAGT